MSTLRPADSYMAHLAAARDDAAALADRLTVAYLAQWEDMTADARASLMHALTAAGDERDAYARQVDWHNRETGAAYPSTPAWTN